MHYGTIEGVELPVSRLIQGTMMISSENLEGSFALLDAVFELGCNAFDTAHIYGGGDCERVMGQWMADRGLRDQVVIVGKGAHHNADRRRVTPFDIAADLHDTLARLKTGYVDLYLLHRDDPAVPVGPIVEALHQHREAGLIRAFGGSNWTHQRIQEANDYAEAHGLTPFAASSPNFTLAEEVEPPWAGCVTISGPANEEAREWYCQEQMPVLAWSSLARGFFSGRFTRDSFATLREELEETMVRSYACEANFERLERAGQLAREKGASVPQIALAWVMNQPLNVFALVGCRSGEEMRANAEALEIELTPEEMDWLDLRCATR